MGIEKKVINTLVLSSLAAKSLVSCSQANNVQPLEQDSNPPPSKEQTIPEEINNPKQDDMQFDLPEGNYSSLDSIPNHLQDDIERITSNVTTSEIEDLYEELEQSEKELDYSILDIYNWKNFELDSIEKKDPGYIITVNNPTSLFTIPLTNDEFFNPQKDVEEIVLNEGINFEIAEIRKIVGSQGEEILIGLIANNYGAAVVPAIIMEAKDSSGTVKEFVEEAESKESSVAYLNLAENIYPNKVYNVYRSLMNLSKYQDSNGPFKAGEEYSFLTTIGLLNSASRAKYLVGFTSSRAEVNGGGVCAMATGMSLLLHQNKDNNILEQWHHPTRYFQGPFSMSPFVVDATVQMAGDGNHYDFRWEFAEDKYIKIDVDMSLSGIPYSETSNNGIGGMSDVNVIYSMSLTDEFPEGQTERLKEQMNNYLEFRKTRHSSDLDSLDHFKYGSDEVEEAVLLLYNREDLSPFQERIESNPTLQSIISFSEAVNNYDEDSELRLVDHIRASDWYENYSEDPNYDEEVLNFAMRILSGQVEIKGQPLQCLSYSILLSILYPELGAQTLGGSQALNANQLINKDNLNRTGTFGTGYGGLMIAGRMLDIDNYMPGDHFVVYNSMFGHLGTILDVFEEDGKRYLLVSDSNRFSDGRVRFFLVDEVTIDYVFGVRHRYIVRSAQNHSNLSAE